MQLTALCLSASLLFLTNGCSTNTHSNNFNSSSSDSLLFLYNTSARLEFDRGESNFAIVSYSKALNRARVMDDPSAIAAAAYNLGICRGAIGDYPTADANFEESQREAQRAKLDTADILLARANVSLLQHDTDDVRHFSGALLNHENCNPTNDQQLGAHVLIGLAAIQDNDIASAQQQLTLATKFSSTSSDLNSQSALAGLAGEIHFASNDFHAAQIDFDRQAILCQQAHNFRTMIRALAKAGRSAGKSGEPEQSADRLYRAARAAIAAHLSDSNTLLTEAATAAASANDPALTRLIASLTPPSTQPAP